jgi:predicted metal-dependent HD superfamily phosphohydrolase
MTTGAAGKTSAFDRFQALWQRCLAEDSRDDSAHVHQRLLAAYAEPQRFYHNLTHIEHCLGMFDEVKSLLSNPDAVELAVWTHDVIYQPGAHDNEARSVEWYRNIAAGVHDPDLVQRVSRHILATLHDGKPLDDEDSRYLVDIDLSSFAMPWEDFLRDSHNLRRENPQISDQEYYRNQGKFQKLLLSRERFYHSDYFYQHYEQRARDNLARYFEYLTKTFDSP